MEATCSLYGLIHARYVLTTAGLEAMYAKYTLQVRCGWTVPAGVLSQDAFSCCCRLRLLVYLACCDAEQAI